jgi:hypothetical protein
MEDLSINNLRREEKVSSQFSTPANSLKSSVKRLFSPKQTNHQFFGSPTTNPSSLPQITTAPSGSPASSIRKESFQQKRVAPTIGTQLGVSSIYPIINQCQKENEAETNKCGTYTNSISLMNPSKNNNIHPDSTAKSLNYIDDVLTSTTIDEASTEFSHELQCNTLSLGSNESSQSNTTLQRNGNTLAFNTVTTTSNQQNLPKSSSSSSTRATSTLKKGFNLLKSNGKKVLMGSSGHEANEANWNAQSNGIFN